MERDFLGLNSICKEPLLAVKREITEQETHRPFTKKASSFSQFMSLKPGSGQVGAMNKMIYQEVPMTAPSPVGQVTGFTESWNNSKSVTAPAQMTIFYAGSVSVYDGISPEEAQAIMLLARNGTFLASNTTLTSHKMHSPDNLQSAVVSSSKDEQVLTDNVALLEHQRVAASSGPISMPAMITSAVPQFRKASLARFLEKRKERVMSTGPYTGEKKQ